MFMQPILPNNGLQPDSLMTILGADIRMAGLLALNLERANHAN
jgi:hypothetical protein